MGFGRIQRLVLGDFKTMTTYGMFHLPRRPEIASSEWCHWVHTNSVVSQKSMMIIALCALFPLALFANISWWRMSEQRRLYCHRTTELKCNEIKSLRCQNSKSASNIMPILRCDNSTLRDSLKAGSHIECETVKGSSDFQIWHSNFMGVFLMT